MDGAGASKLLGDSQSIMPIVILQAAAKLLWVTILKMFLISDLHVTDY